VANFRFIIAATLLGAALLARAQQDRPEFNPPPGPPGSDIGIDQNLDGQIPLDTAWTDENGKAVHLRDYFQGKPVLFVPVFYGCKGICLVTMDGVLVALKGMKTFDVGKDFEVITFSIHPKETPDMAKKMKETALNDYGRPGSNEHWHFLTGTDESIKPLTKALGFRYTYDPESGFIDHPAGIMVATPEGRISKYFIDVNYVPKLVLAALRDAGQQRIGGLTEPVWFGCLSRNKATGALTVNISRIVQVAGVITMLILGTSIFLMSRKYRTTALKPPTATEGT
jgi:protein SCO1/2